jgi:hypothetical protein
MTELLFFKRSETFLGLLAGRKATKLAIVGIMLGRTGRTERDELVAVLLDQFGQVLAVERRHMSRAAVRAIVVAHARPLIEPCPFATGTSVEIQKPSHEAYPMFANDNCRAIRIQ